MAGEGGPGATQDRHENNRAETGKGAVKDTKTHKQTRRPRRARREATRSSKRKQTAAGTGRQEERSKQGPRSKTRKQKPTQAGNKPTTEKPSKRARGSSTAPQRRKIRKINRKISSKYEDNRRSYRQEDQQASERRPGRRSGKVARAPKGAIVKRRVVKRHFPCGRVSACAGASMHGSQSWLVIVSRAADLHHVQCAPAPQTSTAPASSMRTSCSSRLLRLSVRLAAQPPSRQPGFGLPAVA